MGGDGDGGTFVLAILNFRAEIDHVHVAVFDDKEVAVQAAINAGRLDGVRPKRLDW